MEPVPPGTANTGGDGASPGSDENFRIDHLQADLKGRSVRGGFVTLASQGLKFGLSLLSISVLARLLDPADFGLVAMVAVVAGFVSLFKDMGLSMATVQRAEINHAQISTLFWINVAISTALGAVMALSAWPIAWFYGEPRLTTITIVLSLGFPLSGLGIQHQALLRRQMRFTTLAAVEIVTQFVAFCVGVTLAGLGIFYWPDFNYIALAVSPPASSLVAAIGYWIACDWRPGAPRRGTGVRGMVRFGANLTGTQIVSYFARNIDSLLIGKFFGEVVLGLYNRGYSLLLLPQRQCLAPLRNALLPALSRVATDPDRFRRAFYELYEKVAFLTIPLVFALICTADWLVRVVLGPEWDEAATYFVALGPVAVTQVIASTCNWAFVTTGKAHEQLRFAMFNGVLITLIIAVSVYWGPLAVALAYSISGVLIRTPILFWYTGRVTPIQTSRLYILVIPYLVAGAAQVAAMLLLRELFLGANALLSLSVVGSAGVVAYAAALALIPQGRRALKENLLLCRHLFRRFRTT